jgi:hypothetical protein
MVLSLYDFEAVDSDHNFQIGSRAAGSRHRGPSRFKTARLSIVPLCANQFELSIALMAV